MRVDNRDILKRVVVAFMLCVAVVIGASCSQRRQLSDKELARIFHDAFLTNAYASGRFLKLDSLRLYEPIFQKYGYTTEDVQYTIGGFSRRKSARLSDVVEEAIRMLEEDGKALDYEVSILDTVNQIAYRHTIKSVYQDTLIKMQKLRDTSKMLVTLENPKAGQYSIEFDYLIDPLDTTPNGYLTTVWLERDKSDKEVKNEQERGESEERERVEKLNKDKKESEKIEPKKIEVERRLIYQKANRNMVRKIVSHYSNKITVNELCEQMNIQLAMPIKEEGTPMVTVRNLTIKYLPTLQEARDSLYQTLMQVHIFDDEIMFPRKDESMDSL